MSNKVKDILIIGLLAVVLLVVFNPMTRGRNAASNNDDIVIKAIDNYKAETGYSGEMTGEMKNFGCHTELWLVDPKGEVLQKYTVYNGELY